GSEGYYVASHGRLTEVSREVWEYSRWHATITWALFLLAVLALAYLVLFRRLTGTDVPTDLTITVRRDGTLLMDGQSLGVRDAAPRAFRGAVPVCRDYPLSAPPAGAVALFREFIRRGVAFQTVDPAAGEDATPARGR